jgi:hypothetical protein
MTGLLICDKKQFPPPPFILSMNKEGDKPELWRTTFNKDQRA